MLLTEFKAAINKAEELLIKDKGGSGVCLALQLSTRWYYHMKRSYNHLCRPYFKNGSDKCGVDGLDAYFNGDTVPRNLPRRIDSLRLFEQIAISDNLYKDF